MISDWTRIKIFIYIMFLFFLFPLPAYAYMDPTTGSYLFQILVAGFLGSTFFLKSFVKKIKDFFKRK